MAACRLLGLVHASRSPLGLSSATSLGAALSGGGAGWWTTTRAWANWGVPSQPSGSSASSQARTARRPALLPALSAHPTTTGSQGPLTVKYPFLVEYNVDRTALVRSLVAPQPLGIELLPGSVFNVPVRIDLLHRCVRYLRALWQQGTHKTKGRGEVSGGGIKPRPQKGTGRSRQGTIRSPLWRGGGVSMGTRPRSHAHQLPASTRLLGMKCALSAKLNEGRLIILDTLRPPVTDPTITASGFISAPAKPLTAWKAAAPAPKTKHMVAALTALLQDVPARSVLLVDCGEGGEDGGKLLRRAANNIQWAHVMSSRDVTVYHILKHHALVMSQPAVRALTQRLAGGVRVRKPLRHAWWLQQQVAFKEAEARLRQGVASDRGFA